MRLTLVTLLAAVAVLVFALAFTTMPAHAAKAINGTCGVHIGRLVKGFDHEWHMRLGVRRGRVGGPMHCRGLVRVRSSGKGAIGGTLLWRRYGRGMKLKTWRAQFVGSIALESALTAQGCKSAAVGLVAVLATDGLAFPGWATLGASAGCVGGVYNLGQLLPGSDNLIARTVK
jgi:hypothetical protein